MRPDDRDEDVVPMSAETDRLDGEARSESADGSYGMAPRAGTLRSEHEDSRSVQDQVTVLGFVAVGLLCFAATLVFPGGRQLLFPLGAVALFAGVLTYGLTAGRYIDARDGERVYGTCAANLESLANAFGAGDVRMYVPDPGAGVDGVRLFVPTGDEYGPPKSGARTVVDPHGRGLLLEPTGGELYREFRESLSGPLAGSPEPLAEQLTDALRDRFEFVAGATPTVEADERRVVFAVSGSAFGPVDRFDHPVASFLAVGLAAGLDRGVSLEVSAETDGGVWLVSCRWDASTAVVGEGSKSTVTG